MMDKEQAEYSRQRIFELALNIARLQCHGVYVDSDGQLNYIAKTDVDDYIRNFRLQMDHEAKGVLMRGGWEVI